MEKIVEIEISYVNERLKKQNFVVKLTPGSKEFFTEKGFDPSYGARPLKRVIQRFLEDPLAEDIIRGRFLERIKKAEEKPITIKAVKKGQSLKFE